MKYEGGTSFVDYPYYPYSLVISEPVLFSTGEKTFTLNAAGIAYLNEKIVSADKYLRIGIITYEYDYLQEAYLGDNLLQGDDATFATSGNWIVTSGYGTGSLQDEITPDQKTRKVLKIVPTTSESMRVSVSNTFFSSVPTTGVYYFFHCYYRFGQFPTNFDPVGFSGSTYVLLNGKQLGNYSAGLNSNLIRVDDPTGKSPEWQRGHHNGFLDSPGYTNDNTFSFYIGNGSNANYAVNEFAIADVKMVNPVFTKTLGGKYNTPKLKYYYDGYPGAVTTGLVSGVTTSLATLGGTITTDGRTAITVSGLCWNATGSPTIADSKTTDGGTSVTTFSSTATGLNLGQTYYIRPYVTTEIGTYYGVQTSFTTLGLPTVTMNGVSSITTTDAIFSANASSDGGQTITEWGFVYKVGSEPSITDNKTLSNQAPGSIGTFNLGKTGFTPGTTYYVKCYATNASGTRLSSSSVNFTTLANLPTVTTDTSVQSLTSNSCYLNGNVSADGGASVTNRGFCWGTSANPTTSNNSIQQGSGTGSFYSTIGSLAPYTTYYLRGYAVNSAGTAYSTQISFTTLAAVATLTTNTPTLVSGVTYNCGGNITVNGGAAVTTRGYVLDMTGNPSIGLYTNYDSSGSGNGSYSIQTQPLQPNTTYYCKAFATNSVGTAYGPQVSFATTSVSLPAVTTTSPATSIGAGSATVAGNVSADGGASVSEKGICYNTTGAPTNYDSKVTSGTGTGSISSVLTGLADYFINIQFPHDQFYVFPHLLVGNAIEYNIVNMKFPFILDHLLCHII